LTPNTAAFIRSFAPKTEADTIEGAKKVAELAAAVFLINFLLDFSRF
jgi:hypothetical protein